MGSIYKPDAKGRSDKRKHDFYWRLVCKVNREIYK